ncbi:MAG: GNAT family N-acetyltransferase [Acetatifactor sp.]
MEIAVPGGYQVEPVTKQTLLKGYEKYVPIDIEVLEEHRKKGVAKALTIAFVKHCMKCDLVPQWDCVESNKGSIHLAESVERKRELEGFDRFRFAETYF